MEEIPRKHDNKKKNNKTLPVAINIGAGGLGIGGIVLFGGALVTATIMSALAFKRRSQCRRSTSENMNKTMSPETQSVDAPSDEVTSMKEIQTKNIQSLTPDKKHDSGMDNEDIIDSVVVQDQENTLMLIDNENDEHVDANSLVSDEGIISVEEYEAIEDEGEDDHQGTVFMNEAAPVMEGVCMDQVKVEDDLHDEIVLDNCEGELSDETGYADQIVHEVVMEKEEASRSMNKEAKDEETAHEVEEQVTIEDEAAKVDDQTDNSPRKLMNKDENDEISHVESVKEEQDGEEDVTVNVEPSSGVSSFLMQEELTPEAKISNHKTEETVAQVKVEMITDHELVKKDEIPHVESDKEDIEEDVTLKVELGSGVSSLSIREEPTPEPKISNKIEETDVQVKGEMIIDHELVKKDETSHFEFVKEDKESEEDDIVKAKLGSGVSLSSMQKEPTPEAKISNHKIGENVKKDQTILGKSHNDSDDNGVIKEQAFASESLNLKVMAWVVMISLCCLVASLLLILILLGNRNRATNPIKYE